MPQEKKCKSCSFAKENGWWGHSGTHCQTCHRSWTALKESHCMMCHEHFGVPSIFDAHNPGRDSCKAIPVSSGHTFHKDDKGTWRYDGVFSSSR